MMVIYFVNKLYRQRMAVLWSAPKEKKRAMDSQIVPHLFMIRHWKSF